VLIRSAAKNDPANAGWFTNAAGLHFNHEFGAGRIDAAAAVRLASRWTNLGTRISAEAAKLTEDLVPIPAGGLLERTLSISRDLRVEQATFHVDILHPKRGELAIELISPSGTISRLFEAHDDPTADLSHRFGSTFQWGENARGNWRLRVRGTGAASGSLRGFRLEVFGTAIASVPSTVRLVALGQSPEGFRVRIDGTVGQSVKLQRSSDLAAWTDVTSRVLAAASSELVDASPISSGRFYRVVPGAP
jgi:subtilisin-like proprotein convertase family protein